MCQNLAGHGNVQAIHAAVASEDGAVTIANPDADAWGYRTETAACGAAGTIQAMSIQSLIRKAPAGRSYRPFIAKIDIEGFEKNLFSKNTDWIALFPVIVIELHDWMLPNQASSNNFLRAVAQHDRDFVYFGENVFSIANNLDAGAVVGA